MAPSAVQYILSNIVYIDKIKIIQELSILFYSSAHSVDL